MGPLDTRPDIAARQMLTLMLLVFFRPHCTIQVALLGSIPRLWKLPVFRLPAKAPGSATPSAPFASSLLLLDRAVVAT